jgi:hypothetical protein
MRDDDGDRMPETEAEWAEAEAARRKRADWSDAMAEDRQRSQAAWVAKWTAAHTWEPNPRAGTTESRLPVRDSGSCQQPNGRHRVRNRHPHRRHPHRLGR